MTQTKIGNLTASILLSPSVERFSPIFSHLSNKPLEIRSNSEETIFSIFLLHYPLKDTQWIDALAD